MKIELSGTGINITFQSPDNERILYAGLKSTPELPYECATGTCGSCKAKVIEGSFEWAWSEAPARANLKNSDDLLMIAGIAREADMNQTHQHSCHEFGDSYPPQLR